MLTVSIGSIWTATLSVRAMPCFPNVATATPIASHRVRGEVQCSRTPCRDRSPVISGDQNRIEPATAVGQTGAWRRVPLYRDRVRRPPGIRAGANQAGSRIGQNGLHRARQPGPVRPVLNLVSAGREFV